jgi:hypothetical protein
MQRFAPNSAHMHHFPCFVMQFTGYISHNFIGAQTGIQINSKHSNVSVAAERINHILPF